MLPFTQNLEKPNLGVNRNSSKFNDSRRTNSIDINWTPLIHKNSRNRIIPLKRASITDNETPHQPTFYETVNKRNLSSMSSLCSKTSRKSAVLRRISSLGNVLGKVKNLIRQSSLMSCSRITACDEIQYKLIKFDLTLAGKYSSIGFDVLRDHSYHFYVNQIDSDCCFEIANNVNLADTLVRINGKNVFDMSTGHVLKLLKALKGKISLEFRRFQPNKVTVVAKKTPQTSTFGLHIVRGIGAHNPFDSNWYVRYSNPANVTSSFHPQQYDQLVEINYFSVAGIGEEDMKKLFENNDTLILTLLHNRLLSSIMQSEDVSDDMPDSVKERDFIVERQIQPMPLQQTPMSDLSFTSTLNGGQRRQALASVSRCFEVGVGHLAESRVVVLERKGCDFGFHVEFVSRVNAVFVSEVQEDRTVSGNVCVGDQIVSVNNINVETMADKSVVQLLACSNNPIRLVLSYRFEDYITFVQSHFTRDRGFYVKAFFDYTPKDDSAYQKVVYGDVFNVIKKSNSDWWTICSEDGADKVIPSYSRAQHIRQSAQIKTLNYAGADGIFLREDLQSVSYCLVERRTVPTPRPVVLVGFCSDLVANYLLSNFGQQFCVSPYDTTDLGLADISSEAFHVVSERQYKANLQQQLYVDSQLLNGFYYGLPVKTLLGQTRSPLFVNPRRSFLDSLCREKIYPVVIVIKPNPNEQSEDVMNEYQRVSIMQNELGYHVTVCIDHLSDPEDIFPAVLNLVMSHSKSDVFVSVDQLIWF